jgi:glycosyltransferase involved in cell wall biosynthesis
VARAEISIIAPVSNQADIQDVVDEYERALERIGRPHELLLVVNGPEDETLTACMSAAERHPTVRVFRTRKKGWGHAVRIGLAECRGDVVCYTNSARTTGQDLGLILLYALMNPGVVVKANRRIRDSWRRRLGSLLYNLECRALFDLSHWDVNGTPKVFPREFSHLLVLRQKDDLIDAEFASICARERYPILEVPISSSSRRSGRSTTNYISAIKMYWGAWALSRRMRPRGRHRAVSDKR